MLYTALIEYRTNEQDELAYEQDELAYEQVDLIDMNS